MLYKFKIKFEEDDDFIAVVETDVKQSFYHLHDIIQEAIGFNKKQDAAIYTSNDNWKPLKEIALPANYQDLLKEGKDLPLISKYINDPYQKFLYVADKENEWIMEVELMKIEPEKVGNNYPRIVRIEGFAPRQFIAQPIVDDDSEIDAGSAKDAQEPLSPSVGDDLDLTNFPDLGDIDELDFSDEIG